LQIHLKKLNSKRRTSRVYQNIFQLMKHLHKIVSETKQITAHRSGES
jgi:hypothetical protein